MIGVNGMILPVLGYALTLPRMLLGSPVTNGFRPQNPLLKMQVYLGKSTNGIENSGFCIRMPE
jgi:hypothetical protein